MLLKPSAWHSDTDGPQSRDTQRLDGPYEIPVAARPGNAQQIIELMQAHALQNSDGRLTPAAAQAIRAAVNNTGPFQTYEVRTQQIHNFLNNRPQPTGIVLSFNRDHAGAGTAMGARPFVEATIGGRTTRIPMSPP